jgi:hypothetical protein
MKNTEGKKDFISKLTKAVSRELDETTLPKAIKTQMIKRLSMSFHYVILQKDEAIRQKIDGLRLFKRNKPNPTQTQQ